jgi:hypothetical protein
VVDETGSVQYESVCRRTAAEVTRRADIITRDGTLGRTSANLTVRAASGYTVNHVTKESTLNEIRNRPRKSAVLNSHPGSQHPPPAQQL